MSKNTALQPSKHDKIDKRGPATKLYIAITGGAEVILYALRVYAHFLDGSRSIQLC